MAGKQYASAFVGEYIPVQTQAADVEPVVAAPREKLTPEKMEEKATSLLNEYISVLDIGEALLCLKVPMCPAQILFRYS